MNGTSNPPIPAADVLQGKLESGRSGLHGFDADSMISTAAAAGLKSQGFYFCLRYLSRFSPQSGGDLSRAEATNILRGGLCLMPVQHAPRSGWVPSAILGTDYGRAAAENAKAVGFPPGVTVWLDLEGVGAGTTNDAVIDYCNAWFGVVSDSGYETGLYVGANSLLEGDDLFWRLKTQHYWRSGSEVPDIPHRGYQLFQKIAASPDPVNGISIDRNICIPDALGGSPTWLAPIRL
jgi:hypothetical protein